MSWSVSASTIIVPQIIIGEHVVTTDTQTGALLTAPVSTNPELPPPPATAAIDIESILDLSANFGTLGIMSLRSAFGLLVQRLAQAEAVVADISNNKIPELVAAELSNASLDAAREAAQALKDAAQDASAAMIELSASTAAADIAAVSGRVATLESDVATKVAQSAYDAYVASNDAAVAAKAAAADLSAYIASNDAAVASKAAAADVSAIDSRVAAVEAAVPTKVAQADYDVFVAATDAALANKADSTAVFNLVTTKADVTSVELIGRQTKLETAEISGQWTDAGAQIKAAALEGKLSYINYTPENMAVFLDIGGVNIGTTFRIHNAGTYEASFSTGNAEAPGQTVVAAPGETITVQFNGAQWRLL